VIDHGPGDPVDVDRTLASPNPPKPATRTRWAIASVYGAILVAMALIPSVPTVGGFAVPDWLAHAFAYGLQAGLFFWGSSPSVGTACALVIGILGAAALGVFTEGLQWLHPSRSVEVRDLLADVAGATVVCSVAATVALVFSGRAR